MTKRERSPDDTPNNNHNKKPRLQHKLRGLGDGTQVRHIYTSWMSIITHAYL